MDGRLNGSREGGGGSGEGGGDAGASGGSGRKQVNQLQCTVAVLVRVLRQSGRSQI